MKTCKECNNPVFGGGYCKYHQFKRKMKGGDLYKPKPRQKSPLPKESKKREKERIYYLDQVKMFWKECVENGNDFCFFCGQKMTKREDTHHLKGRIGDYYLDKEFSNPVYRFRFGKRLSTMIRTILLPRPSKYR